MTIHLSCTCGATFKATANQVGKTLQCSHCRQPILVPPPDQAPSTSTAPPLPSSAASTSVSSSPPPESHVPGSLLSRAKSNETAAITRMFQQFIPADEEILFAEYLGREGMFGIGQYSFGCLTNRRIASIRVKTFGEVLYQDGFLEYLNSSIVYQPSELLLYVIIVCMVLLALPTLGLSLLLLPFAGRIFYAFKKSGVVFVVKEGVSVYLFTNRNLLVRANTLARRVTRLRDDRIKLIGSV